MSLQIDPWPHLENAARVIATVGPVLHTRPSIQQAGLASASLTLVKLAEQAVHAARDDFTDRGLAKAEVALQEAKSVMDADPDVEPVLAGARWLVDYCASFVSTARKELAMLPYDPMAPQASYISVGCSRPRQ